ncbi:Uncharacterized protein F42A8.1 [Toxocara canis]|uniref:Uncharacterized protein F42A8.1 n=2 Tax=Toxocara canis TaxID=6265 RepID=A0A0B2VP48_TOXCA|nr:Uncharacterized protein F42A8.1 [Toxocara canis]VDM43362.1 unnamed protein product [Toxocara canis]
MTLRPLAVVLLFVGAHCLNTDQQSRRRCWSSGNGRPAQWWDQGERVDRGRYWYECSGGELQPRGCFTPTDERIFIYGTFVHNGYEMQCVIGGDGYLQFKFTACIPENGTRRYVVGETWEDEQHMYWFVCNADGPYLRMDIGGCVSHNKQFRIRLDDYYDFGEYTYQCQKKYNGTVQMCSVGCIHKGVHYKVGQQWPDGDFVYYCKLNGGRCQKVCVGCQFRDKRLYDGDRYQKDDTVFQCEVRPDKYGHKPVGCVVRDEKGDAVERIVGCRWYQTTKNAKVEQTCVLENNRTVVKTLGCIFVYKGYDTLFVYPGTYTIWNQQMDGTSIGVACRENGNNGLPSLETFKTEELPYKIMGLRYDQPRGK